MKTKKLFKSGVCFALSVGISLSMISCTNKPKEETKVNPNFKFATDELSFTWYDNSDTAAATQWADTSLIEKWITDNKKVKIKYMDPGGASAEKLATMIVSDSFPDVMTMLRGQDTEKLIESKKIIPLDDYMKKYTQMSSLLTKNKILDMMKYKDGKNYEIPNWANIGDLPNGNNAWVLNTKVYNELGRPAINTLDDFYSYLKQVKEKYPDMIPYETTDSFQGERYILSASAEDLPPDHLNFYSYPKDGELVSIFEHPAYRETSIFLNKLFREKLMTQDAFSQTADQVKEKFSNGKVAVTTSAIGVCEETRGDLKKMGSDWETITPPMKDGLDRKKVYSQGYDVLGWTEILITKDAKNPEGIYQYFDWLFGPEGQRLYGYGPRGTYYDEVTPEGYPVLNEKWFSTKEPMKEMKGNGGGVGLGNTFFDTCGVYVDEHSPEEYRSWGKKQQTTNIWPYARNITEYSNIIPGAGVDEGVIFQTITDLHKQGRAKMLFAKSQNEVEEILDKLINDTKKAGMDKLLKYENTKWQENKAKLNSK